MSTNAPVVIPPTVPYVIITEQPLYTNLYGLNSYPFWFWLVVAGGGFTAVVIIIIGIIICIRKRRTCFWCCCEGFDAESNAPMVGKPPAVKAANHWMAVNDGYVPRAQRLSHGHQQQKFAHIDDLNEIDYDDGRRSAFGGTMYPPCYPVQSELAVVRVGGSASAMGPAKEQKGSATGQHSASIQVSGKR